MEDIRHRKEQKAAGIGGRKIDRFRSVILQIAHIVRDKLVVNLRLRAVAGKRHIRQVRKLRYQAHVSVTSSVTRAASVPERSGSS